MKHRKSTRWSNLPSKTPFLPLLADKALEFAFLAISLLILRLCRLYRKSAKRAVTKARPDIQPHMRASNVKLLDKDRVAEELCIGAVAKLDDEADGDNAVDVKAVVLKGMVDVIEDIIEGAVILEITEGSGRTSIMIGVAAGAARILSDNSRSRALKPTTAVGMSLFKHRFCSQQPIYNETVSKLVIDPHPVSAHSLSYCCPDCSSDTFCCTSIIRHCPMNHETQS